MLNEQIPYYCDKCQAAVYPDFAGRGDIPTCTIHNKTIISLK